MLKQNIREKLKELVMANAVVKISGEAIKESTDLINDLGFDSARIMRFLAEVEKQFGIEIEDEHLSLESLGKFGNLKEAIELRINNS